MSSIIQSKFRPENSKSSWLKKSKIIINYNQKKTCITTCITTCTAIYYEAYTVELLYCDYTHHFNFNLLNNILITINIIVKWPDYI